MPETHLNADEIAGFNLAVDLYTNLMFNQKELMTRIVESAYSAGLNDGIAYAQQQIVAVAQQQEIDAEEAEAEARAQAQAQALQDALQDREDRLESLKQKTETRLKELPKELPKEPVKDAAPLDVRDPGILARLRRGGK
jgi:hypothetical protein